MKEYIKLKYYDASYILGYKQTHLIQKYFCQWKISSCGKQVKRLECNIKLPVFIITYIPMLVIIFLYYLWDEGLRHFSFPTSRNIYRYTFFKNDYAYTRANVILSTSRYMKKRNNRNADIYV